MTTKALERQVGRVFSPRAHCGLNATGVTSPIRRSLAAMSLFGFLLLRLAVNEDFELSAGWISNLHLQPVGRTANLRQLIK
jgi:hypothetical protein